MVLQQEEDSAANAWIYCLLCRLLMVLLHRSLEVIPSVFEKENTKWTFFKWLNWLDGLEENSGACTVQNFSLLNPWQCNQNLWGFWSLLYPGLQMCPAKHLTLQSWSETLVPFLGFFCCCCFFFHFWTIWVYFCGGLVPWKAPSETSFARRTSLMAMAFKCQHIPITLGLLWVCWHSKITHTHTHTHTKHSTETLRKQHRFFFLPLPSVTTRDFEVSFVLLWMHHLVFQKLSWMFLKWIILNIKVIICVLLPDESAYSLISIQLVVAPSCCTVSWHWELGRNSIAVRLIGNFSAVGLSFWCKETFCLQTGVIISTFCAWPGYIYFVFVCCGSIHPKALQVSNNGTVPHFCNSQSRGPIRFAAEPAAGPGFYSVIWNVISNWSHTGSRGPTTSTQVRPRTKVSGTALILFKADSRS